MKLIKHATIRLALIIFMALTSSGAYALDEFESFGPIKEISSNGFKIHGTSYRISPTASLKTSAGARINQTDLKPGDVVWISGTVFSSTKFVSNLILNDHDL